jgi:hypothetical protein
MKILITGTTGLSQELANVHVADTVACVSKSTGHDILNIDQWGFNFLDCDLVYNCAYDGIGQQLVLDYFFNHWQHDQTKCIVSIGSKVISQPRLEHAIDHQYWPYRTHKQYLQLMHDQMWPTALCNLKIINPGAFDSNMILHLNVPKIKIQVLAKQIQNFACDPTVKRVDLWL